MVVGCSNQYIEAEILGGIFLGGIISLIITALYFNSSVWSFIPVSFILFFPTRLLFRKFPVLKISFIGFRRREEAVRQRAVRAFYEKGLYKTRKIPGFCSSSPSLRERSGFLLIKEFMKRSNRRL